MLPIILSAALVLIGGYFAGNLVERIRLPALLGMMLFGIPMAPIAALAIEYTHRNLLTRVEVGIAAE